MVFIIVTAGRKQRETRLKRLFDDPQLAIFPGDHAFRIVSLRTPDGELDPGRWEAVFDLTLMSAGDLYATAVDPVTLARYGHFASAELPWERLQI